MNALHRDALVAACLLASVAGWVKPADASPVLDAAKLCRKALSTKGRTYADKRTRLLLNCVDKLLKCALRAEIEGENPGSCRSRAEDSCKRSVGPANDSGINRAVTAFDDKIFDACSDIGLATMLSTAAGGLWFGNDATCGMSASIPVLLDCLRGRLDVHIDATVGRTKPRAGLLLDNIGLGGNYPNLPRPPTITVTVTATAGVLNQPGVMGTISPAAGEAVKFLGDPMTVPCGGGMNGKLTITVGVGVACPPDLTMTPAQQVVIKEPYGPAEPAVFGPFLTDQAYCIERKDGGSCMDNVSGTIDVP